MVQQGMLHKHWVCFGAQTGVSTSHSDPSSDPQSVGKRLSDLLTTLMYKSITKHTTPKYSQKREPVFGKGEQCLQGGNENNLFCTPSNMSLEPKTWFFLVREGP